MSKCCVVSSKEIGKGIAVWFGNDKDLAYSQDQDPASCFLLFYSQEIKFWAFAKIFQTSHYESNFSMVENRCERCLSNSVQTVFLLKIEAKLLIFLVTYFLAFLCLC